MNEPTTAVIFRKWKDTGGIIAFFPEIDEGYGLCCSYEHIGQHRAAAYPNNTVLAKPEEYAALKQELESAPYHYRFKVYRRWGALGKKGR